MSWDYVVEYLKIQGTIGAIALGVALLGLIFVKGLELASIAFVKYVSLPPIRWPEINLPNVAWKQISEPARKAMKMILVIVAVVGVGVAAPFVFTFWLAGAANVVEPVAYVSSGAILSAIVVSMAGLVLLVKPDVRTSVSENGLLNTLVLYIIAISWLALVIAILPLMLASD